MNWLRLVTQLTLRHQPGSETATLSPPRVVDVPPLFHTALADTVPATPPVFASGS